MAGCLSRTRGRTVLFLTTPALWAHWPFLPVVRRAEMARAVSRVLELVAQRNPQLAAAWRASQRKFPDLGPGHPNFPTAALAVDAGVMATAADGSFQLTRPVAGSEAVASITRLAQLAGQPAR